MNGMSAGNVRKFKKQLVALGIPQRTLRRLRCCSKVELTYPGGTTRVVAKTEDMPGALDDATSAKLV